MATKQKSKARTAAKSAKGSLSAGGNAALAGKEALAGTRAAGKAVSAATTSAKLPLIAGGSLLAGLSGGLAVIRHRRNNR